MITGLKDLMVMRLETFREKSKRLCSRVLVYRDGVFEGQYSTAMRDEMSLTFQSFDTNTKPTINTPYRPKLTIVVCGKRHHTRFFPTDASHAEALGNSRPGTVVDQGVAGVYAFNFFLQAHGGLQVTTRLTNYFAVHDEIGFGVDGLQKLMKDVSDMFARATKAVSLMSPAYYADLAYVRGRCYIHELLTAVKMSSAGGESSSGRPEDEVVRIAQRLWQNGIKG
jgi:eukaryotic translation initiation factor 2C